jgi:hypothetical protein
VDDRNWAAETPPTDWQGRCNLARSILNHRPPSEHAVALAVLALYGSPAGDLFELDTMRLTLGETPGQVFTFTESGVSA